MFVVLAVTASLLSCAQPGSRRASLFTSSTVPRVTADPDTRSVVLATRITASSAGEITALRFYKSRANVGKHLGFVWDANGR